MIEQNLRRRILKIAAASSATALLPALAITQTPAMTEGPFYPRAKDFPLDQDNDLTRIQGIDGVAAGTILDLAGRVLDASEKPVAGATVEIWQCNHHGRYHHSGDNSTSPLDPFFQGFGKTVTDPNGNYRFRTIRPVAYPGRVPHIHFKVKAKSFVELTTQMFVAGDPGLDRDFVWRAVGDADAKKRLVIELKPATGDRGATFDGNFDIVLSSRA